VTPLRIGVTLIATVLAACDTKTGGDADPRNTEQVASGKAILRAELRVVSRSQSRRTVGLEIAQRKGPDAGAAA
jgi:hypothetical protein